MLKLIRHTLLLAPPTLAVVCLLAAAPTSARAGMLVMSSCSDYADSGYDIQADGSVVWQGRSYGNFSTPNECPQGRSFQITPGSNAARTNQFAQWQTTAPAGIHIIHAYTPTQAVLYDNTPGDGWAAKFFWSGGSQPIQRGGACCDGMDYGSQINRSIGPSSYFGWRVKCTLYQCGAPYQILDVRGIQLQAIDNVTPNIIALASNNIWYQNRHWIRGSGWPASFEAFDNSGVCAMQAIVAGQTIPGPSAASRNTHSWTQCPTPQTMDLTIDTEQYPNGALALTLWASDATTPANIKADSETLHVDNTPVTLTLSGPTDAPSTSGTQYIIATATAGPSGAWIACSLDGAAYQWYASESARIPVSGAGTHHLSCFAQNGAINPYGLPARSQTQTWTLKIGIPTNIGLAFRDRVRAHRTIYRLQQRVPHGRGATVQGWLRTSTGAPLAGQAVAVLAAADNGLYHFRDVKIVRTRSNGTWSARLRAGPSRLVEAVYAGGPYTQPAISTRVRLIVPAKIRLLRVYPSHVRWGETVHIVGQLYGGYIPPGGALVRLRIGYGRAYTTYGVQEHVTGNGRFTTTYRFGIGPPGVKRTFWFQIATLPMGDFPWAPAASHRWYVVVQG